MWDKLAVVRSLVSVDEHSDSLVMTGYSENTQPHRRTTRRSARSCRKLRGDGSNDVPPFVSLRGMSIGTEPGYLGVAHRPFTPDGPGLAEPAPRQRRQRRRGWTTARTLLGQFDTVRRDIDASGTMKGMDAFTGRAFDMVASGAVRKALDLKQRRPADPRPLQGRRAVPHRPPAGRSRRRLRHARYGGWDTHGSNFKTLKRQLPEPRPRHRQPDPGPARPRHGRRRGDGRVGRVRPHAEDQQQRRAAATTGPRSCRRWSPAAA